MQNYHKHTSYSIGDSAAMPEDYAKRAVELGHKVICSVEHGWQGYYHKYFELAQTCNAFDKENEECINCKKQSLQKTKNCYDHLKFVFGTEAYWVKDREEKDRSNCHIFIAAMNEKGRRALNDVLSEDNLTGFYGQPRLDARHRSAPQV